jgi:hypothetical protein
VSDFAYRFEVIIYSHGRLSKYTRDSGMLRYGFTDTNISGSEIHSHVPYANIHFVFLSEEI